MKIKYLLSCLETSRSLSLTHCDVTDESCVFRNPSNFLYFHIDNFRKFMMAEKPFQFDPGIVFIHYIVYSTAKLMADKKVKSIVIQNAFTCVHNKPKILFWNQLAMLDVTGACCLSRQTSVTIHGTQLEQIKAGTLIRPR